jgi:hypothetical protein
VVGGYPILLDPAAPVRPLRTDAASERRFLALLGLIEEVIYMYIYSI